MANSNHSKDKMFLNDNTGKCRWFWDTVVDNLFIVWINDTSKVRQGAITDFYIVPVKDFM